MSNVSRPRRMKEKYTPQMAVLRPLRFSSGFAVGRIELTPQLHAQERRLLSWWIRRLPESFCKRLPPLKIAVAERLRVHRSQLFVNQNSASGRSHSGGHTHAASFIPQRYIIFRRELFRRRVELGRIAYHEFCHFVWPGLGNSKRRLFASLLEQEFREGLAGELGHSSAARKEKLREPRRAGLAASPRAWRDYACESFCDTGSFVLLGKERRARHSEYSLNAAACKRRSRFWSALVLELPAAQQGAREAPQIAEEIQFRRGATLRPGFQSARAGRATYP